MSVYYKTLNGDMKKVAGYLSQRVNARWFKCQRIMENGQEYYVVPAEETQDYFKTISPFTIYNFGFEESNTTTNPKLKYKDLTFSIRDISNRVDESVGIAQLKGVFSMFTQELGVNNKIIYFIGDLHKDYGVLSASATLAKQPGEEPNVQLQSTRTEQGYLLDFTFNNIQGESALSYNGTIPVKYEAEQVVDLDISKFNRIPSVGDAVYILSANQYFTLLTIQTVTDTTVRAKVINNTDLITNISEVEEQLNINTQNLNELIVKIPNQASSENQLADKDFVNSTVNSMSAFYITVDAEGNPFPTKADLDNATTVYSDGEARIPTKNDYCFILADETHDNASVRYRYSGSQWEFQFIVNGTSFTAAQLAALNSGITSDLVVKINRKADLDNRDQSITAGYITTDQLLMWDLDHDKDASLHVMVSDGKTYFTLAGHDAVANNETQYVFSGGALIRDFLQVSDILDTRRLKVGNKNSAIADCSLAQGYNCFAYGYGSHAQGADTETNASYSHAEGLGTRARKQVQHVLGKYNIYEASGLPNELGTYVEIVGNGTSNTNRSNARTLDWEGNEVLAGSMTINNSGTMHYDEATDTFTFDGNVSPTESLLKDIMLNYAYPVGSYYITENENLSTEDLVASHFGGTWKQIESGTFLEASSSGAGTPIAAGLPNIEGTFTANRLAIYEDGGVVTSGPFNLAGRNQGSGQFGANYDGNHGALIIGFNASRANNIYGNSTTVQPKSIKVYIYRRIA